MNERVSIGGTIAPRGSGPIAQAVEALEGPARTSARTPSTKDELMQLWIEAEVLRLTNLRASQNRKMGSPGPEGSTGKLAYAEANKDDLRVLRRPAWAPTGCSTAATTWSGPTHVDGRRHGARRRSSAAAPTRSRAARRRSCATSSASAMLGLPGDVRVDREVAWKDVPRN